MVTGVVSVVAHRSAVDYNLTIDHLSNFAHVCRWVPFWKGHDIMTEYGNFVGDAFWTLEPALTLWLGPLIQRARGKRKRKIAA